MIEKSRMFNLKGRQLLYTQRRVGENLQDVEKRLVELRSGEDFAKRKGTTPIITVTKANNGSAYIYNNKKTFESVTAIGTPRNPYTVSIPSKNGETIVGYVKDGQPIAWTRNKDAKKLLNKIASIIRNGF